MVDSKENYKFDLGAKGLTKIPLPFLMIQSLLFLFS